MALNLNLAQNINHIKQHPSAYSRLMRLDKPVGIYLLLWPTFWALLMASEGLPSIGIALIFTAGVVVMRSAGCVINDYADRKVDGSVKRTATRPLATGGFFYRLSYLLTAERSFEQPFLEPYVRVVHRFLLPHPNLYLIQRQFLPYGRPLHLLYS